MVKPLRSIFLACFPACLSLAVLAGATLAQAPQSKQVDVFGQKIHYLEAGSGPAVILLHGLGGDTSNWMFTIPALASRYHVYVPDQIGFGQSDKPWINYRVGTLIEFLHEFCEKVGIEKASIVGNSLGGWTAAAFALVIRGKSNASYWSMPPDIRPRARTCRPCRAKPCCSSIRGRWPDSSS
jgi:hypothetical protein